VVNLLSVSWVGSHWFFHDAAGFHDPCRDDGKQDVAPKRDPSDAGEAKERFVACDQMRHNIKRKNPKGDAVSGGGDDPWQRRNDFLLQRASDQQVTQGIDVWLARPTGANFAYPKSGLSP